MKKLLISIVVIILVVIGGWYLSQRKAGVTSTNTQTTNTDQVFPESSTPATADMIVVNPISTSTPIKSPLKVTGKARGTWFFEASAPIAIVDIDGKPLGTGHIEATSDWMTTEFVPFTGTIEFTLATSTPDVGAVVFFNDNPSGQASTSYYTALPVFLR